MPMLGINRGAVAKLNFNSVWLKAKIENNKNEAFLMMDILQFTLISIIIKINTNFSKSLDFYRYKRFYLSSSFLQF